MKNVYWRPYWWYLLQLKKKILQRLSIHFRYLYKQAKQFTSTHQEKKFKNYLLELYLTFLQIQIFQSSKAWLLLYPFRKPPQSPEAGVLWVQGDPQRTARWSSARTEAAKFRLSHGRLLGKAVSKGKSTHWCWGMMTAFFFWTFSYITLLELFWNLSLIPTATLQIWGWWLSPVHWQGSCPGCIAV